MLGLFLGTLFFFIMLGMPIVFALALSNIAMLIALDIDFFVLVSRMISGVNSFPLLAIPFFMFVGKLMDSGGIAKRLVNLADALVGFITGGLGHVNILASMFFGGISGSAIADTAAIGGLIIPPMVEEGYTPEYSGAVTAASATIGIIIPPSIPFILYGIVTGTSISRMFMGGFIPGILIGLVLMMVVYFTAKKGGFGVSNTRPSLSYIVRSFKEAFLALTLPLVIVGGILGGIFTATEAGVIASALALILAVFVYKEVQLKDMPKIMLETGKVTSVVLFLCGMAMVTAWLLTVARVPFVLAESITSISSSPIVVMLLVNALLLLVGCVMDLTPALLILAPILLPVAKSIGLDPVYFGVVMCMNLGIGLVTPPIGTVLYVASGVANVKLDKLVRAMAPFYVALVAVLVLVILFPQIVLFIPSLM